MQRAKASSKDPAGNGNIQQTLAVAGAVAHTTLPAWIQTGVMVGLIFGGCCSNVFALESIVKTHPDAGLLITITQFLLVAMTGYAAHFSPSNPPFYLKPNAVPLSRWFINLVLFFSVNMLNNYAFGFNISVPVHIILRSGGSVTTMLIGWLWGKRFTRLQIISVALLTLGVVIAATADAQAQGKTSSNPETSTSVFISGLVILFLAQVLSAFMGLYVQRTYEIYGQHWRENLFYSHFLSLPLFLPFLPSMRRQLTQVAASPPLTLPTSLTTALPPPITALFAKFTAQIHIHIPRQIALLFANAVTQYACVRGVNLLGARSSALTVTIVLNIRKLASLLLSIWLFGNRLAPGVLVGAVVVFSAGALYAWEGQRRATAAAGAGAGANANARAVEKKDL
ncbi:MAG: golgi uridine diphosphate-N- acetylglucosamine transporter [Thelocarpon superellum]|nr:MAG: golgi uridine diphosphate-N- acetylglucosamine transporter [Thelocarpon superellum]